MRTLLCFAVLGVLSTSVASAQTYHLQTSNAQERPIYLTERPVPQSALAPCANTNTTLQPIPHTVSRAVYQPVSGTTYTVPYSPTPPTLRPAAPLPSSYYVGRGLLGQPKLYVPGQPIRNTLRWLSF